MVSLQKLFPILLAFMLQLVLSGFHRPVDTTSEPALTEPTQMQEDPLKPSAARPAEPEAYEVTPGTEIYRDFLLDNILHAEEGDIHFHLYIPDSYDGSEPYALYLTLPGYEGLYFQGVGQTGRDLHHCLSGGFFRLSWVCRDYQRRTGLYYFRHVCSVRDPLCFRRRRAEGVQYKFRIRDVQGRHYAFDMHLLPVYV